MGENQCLNTSLNSFKASAQKTLKTHVWQYQIFSSLAAASCNYLSSILAVRISLYTWRDFLALLSFTSICLYTFLGSQLVLCCIDGRGLFKPWASSWWIKCSRFHCVLRLDQDEVLEVWKRGLENYFAFGAICITLQACFRKNTLSDNAGSLFAWIEDSLQELQDPTGHAISFVRPV